MLIAADMLAQNPGLCKFVRDQFQNGNSNSLGRTLVAMLLSDRIVMMINGPTVTIGEMLSIDLGRPRKRVELSDNAHYNQLGHQVLSFLYERLRKVENFSAAKKARNRVEEPSRSARAV